MSDNFKVVRVGAEAAASLASVHAQGFSDAWPAATFEALLGRPYVLALAVLVNPGASLRGFILIQVIADEAEVLTFCVEPEFRGHKLGAALLEAAAEVAREMGVAQIFLEVSEANAVARGLYARQEFVVVGRRSAYYRDPAQASPGTDALVMRKTLRTGPASAN